MNAESESFILDILRLISTLTDDERELLYVHLRERYCRHCGNSKTPCYCERDE